MLLVGVLFWLFLDESVPVGKEGPEAEAMADKMLSAINYTEYQQLTFLSWTYRGGVTHEWWKQEKKVKASWDDLEVLLDLNTLDGSAKKNGIELTGIELEEALKKAWSQFANDSFWLVAPWKIRDPGTKRAVVEYEGERGLLVTYSSGGVTPGDSYLWLLDENGRPREWKIWTSILPWGGIRFTWENWQMYGDVPFSNVHNGLTELPMVIHEIR